MPNTAPPDRVDYLKPARALLLAAAGLTLAPVVLMTADHLIRQKPAAARQAAVWAAIGLSTPCVFPSGHPARWMSDTASGIDWRPTPALPPAPPGPIDLVRPRATSRKASARAR